MSGLLAHRLAGKAALDEPEEAFVCAMFHSLGKHLAIFYFPEEYRVVSDRIQRESEKEGEAARAVLGVTYAELGVGVANYWGFPVSLTESMQALPPGKLRPPGVVMRSSINWPAIAMNCASSSAFWMAKSVRLPSTRSAIDLPAP